MTTTGITGIKSAAEFIKYISRNSGMGGTFDGAVREAAEKIGGGKSDEQILGETLYGICKSKQQENSEKKEEKKDFWELRTERQKLLDEQFEKALLQRKAFEKLSQKRQQSREYFFNGEGVLFLNSAAENLFSL